VVGCYGTRACVFVIPNCKTGFLDLGVHARGLRGRVDCFRCISNGVGTAIGESEVDIFASWSVVSSPGILLCAGDLWWT